MPINYLNLYLFSIFGGLLTTLGGVVICYSGMSEASFLVNKGMEITTYYLDKNRYDLHLFGLVYSITFGVALLLLLAAIVIPTKEQIKKRTSETQIGETSGAGIPYTPEAITTDDETETIPESDESLEIELEPDLESFGDNEDEQETAVTAGTADEDSDVIGTSKSGRFSCAANSCASLVFPVPGSPSSKRGFSSSLAMWNASLSLGSRR